MRNFIISESQLVMLTTRAKPVDLTLQGRREWKELLNRCRKHLIPEGTEMIRCYGTNKEGNNTIKEIILPKAHFE
jgi:hypothetical protein